MGMSKAVLDAGPLIHLAELDALDVLSDFEVLCIPPVVWDEIVRYQPKVIHALLPIERIDAPVIDSRLIAFAKIFSLDPGEIQSLAVMANYPDALFLTDDSAARLVAEEFGYKVHGTLGLLIRSVRQGRLSPNEVLEILRNVQTNSSLYIRTSLLLDVIKRLEKEWQSR